VSAQIGRASGLGWDPQSSRSGDQSQEPSTGEWGEGNPTGEWGEGNPTGDWGELTSSAGDWTAFESMFDAHAGHLFDYCSGLLGDEAEAASATEAALIAAQSLLQDRERMRAWLFALARRECISKDPDRSRAAANESSFGDEGDDLARPILPAFSALHDEDREILDLVYRHGIRPDDLPAILGVSPDQAEALLAAAVAELNQSAELGAELATRLPDDDASNLPVEQISALPLAPLPASIWSRTARGIFGTGLGSESRSISAEPTAAESWVSPVRRSAGLVGARKRLAITGIVLTSVAAAASAVIYLADRPSPAHQTHRYADPTPVAPVATQTSSTASTAPAAHSRSHHKARKSVPIRALFPQAPTQGIPPVVKPKHKPRGRGHLTPPPHPITSSPSPSPTKHKSPSPTPSPSPSPSPSPTA